MKEFEGNAPGSPGSVRRVGAVLAAVVVSAVVIFSLGVMVGKRVTDTASTVAEPPPTLPTETLVRPAYGPGDSSPGEEAAAEGKEEKLTFFNTLSSEKAQPPALPKKPEEAARPPVEEKAAAEVPEKKQPAAEQKPPPAPPKAASLSPQEEIKSLLGPGRYYVQVASTTSRQGANDLVRKLGKKGLPADSMPATIKGKQWYRIKVGSFPDRTAAVKAQGILKKRMSLDGMVVTVD